VREDHWHIRRSPWLDGIKPAMAAELRRAALVRSYAPAESIFGPLRLPENVWLVEQGLVRLHRLAPDGREVTIALVRPGHLFGEVPVLGDLPRVSFAEAMRRSTCWRIPRSVFLGVLRADPDASFSLSKEIAGKLARVESRLEDLAFRSVDARLARILFLLSEDFGRDTGEWVILDLALTQSELAQLIGTTRQSVSDSMRSLIGSGCVSRDRGFLALKLPELVKVGESMS
jgi:CRP/FNR family transcriptional regulator, cyclic AMP receptor protein